MAPWVCHWPDSAGHPAWPVRRQGQVARALRGRTTWVINNLGCVAAAVI